MHLPRSKKAVVFSCIHAPLFDEQAVERTCGIIRREKPDYVVCLGDLLEANAASRWDDAREMEIHLAAEFQSANGVLKRLRESAPAGAEFICLEGNHDQNISEPGRIDKRLRSLCDWTDTKNIAEMQHWNVGARYKYCRKRGCWRLGQQVVFSHGYETSSGPIKREAFYFAPEFGLYLHGHTHRPTENIEQVVWSDMPLRRWFGNVGCLRSLSPHYMERKRKWGWGHAVGIVEAVPLKSPRACREWSARIEVLGMYDEVAIAA